MTQTSPRLLAGLLLLVALARGAAAYSYKFLGCFKDSTAGWVMSNKHTFGDLSPEVCQQHCLGLNLPLFGLHNGEECGCASDDIGFDTSGEGSELCDTECSGHSHVICGGHLAFSLYRTEPFTLHTPGETGALTLHKPDVVGLAAADEFLGCFADDRNDRVLANMVSATNVTPEGCEVYCGGLQKPFYATQYGSECWCGGPELTPADYLRHGLGNCNIVCNGDANVLCGGSFAFSLYETDALEPRDPDYLGCYADDRDNRVFEFQYSDDFNTPELCKANCAGGAFYALQYGRECWCGALPDIEYDISGPGTCDRECSGVIGQLCGGVYAFDVFSLPTSEEEGPCNPNPCLNGGSCSVDPAGGHICTCATGYGGMSCQTNTAGLPEFYIEFEDFSGPIGFGLGPSRLDRLHSAAARWEEVITHTPCGGSDEYPEYPAGRVYISLRAGSGRIATVESRREKFWEECDITIAGSFDFESRDIFKLEDDQFEELVFHEIGHIIGIGYAWAKCTPGCNKDGSSEYGCPAAAAAYNDLAGNAQGTPAFIVGQAEKYGLLQCWNFSPGALGAEAMVGFAVNYDPWPLSKITVAALEDLGYIVDPSKAEEYFLPG